MSDTVKLPESDTMIIAHRGLSGIECENTAAAFVAAANRSYFGIETDIHATADGQLVIIHDETTKRVSDTDINVETSSFSEIRKVILNDREGRKRHDLVIPTPAEYISICSRYGKTAVIEIKNRFTPDMIEKTVEEIKKTGYLENVIFISFFFENLTEIRKHLPNQPVQFLTGECDGSLIKKLAEHNMDIDIEWHALTAELTEKLHKNGIKVNCWTCDDIDSAKTLIDFGVDFITSDILE